VKIWILGLEPLETRYTGEWYSQFKKVFKELGVSHEFIYGDVVTMNLESKFFLDPIGTNIWKTTQMSRMLNKFDKVREGDAIFTWDFWHPALECLAYIRSFLKKKFYLVGIAHSGTYDPWDLTYQIGMGRYGKFFEEGWFQILDKVFVATTFHKELILKSRTVDERKLCVTGLPVDIEHVSRFRKPWGQKEDLIVFTGRKSAEKGYDLVLKLRNDLNLPIVVALDLGLKKKDYHKLLGKAKIVFAPSKQETFGYGVVEGIANGCVPVVPNGLSFQDYVLKKFRYEEGWSFREILSNGRLLLDPLLEEQEMAISKYDYKKVIRIMADRIWELGE